MNLFNYVKSQIPILQIIGEYTSLKPAGIYWRGICPFHSEKTASFTVSPHKEIFYCFGCHATGDVVSFIARIENYSQLDSAKFLIDRFSLKLPKEIDQEFKNIEQNAQEKDLYFKLCKLISDWCHQHLKKSNDIQKYLKDRGFNKDIIDKFNLGFFPQGQVNIKSFLKFCANNGYLAQDLIKFSILMESKNTLYSPFEDRVIFPICDQLSRVCGFGGRVYNPKDERVKYYNSHENEYFNKGATLYGLDLARKSIQDKGYTFLVEGYTDCIAMVQNGYTNTIATLGTACTIEHLKLLSRFTDQVYILYDGDLAGQNAVLRLTEMCWNVNIELKVVCLENKEDPASFLYKNGNLQELINSAKDIYSFFIASTSYNFSTKTLHEKIWTVKKLTDIIRNINDPLKRDILLQEASTRLNVPFESIKKNYENSKILHKTKQPEQTNDTFFNKDDEFKSISNLEKRLFSSIMNNFNLLDSSLFYISSFFSSPTKEILNTLIELKENNKNIEFNEFYNSLNESQQSFVNRVLLENDQQTNNDFTSLLNQFQKKNWKKIANLIQQKLIEAQKNSDKQTMTKLINEFQELKEKLLKRGCNV